MLSTLHVRSIVALAFCVLDRYTSERFGRLRSTRGEGASGVSAEFEYYSNRVCVPGQINEILEPVDVHLYVPFALEVAVQLESHERGGCLVLWAERHHEFLSGFVP
jgi:hypothetical protein